MVHSTVLWNAVAVWASLNLVTHKKPFVCTWKFLCWRVVVIPIPTANCSKQKLNVVLKIFIAKQILESSSFDVGIIEEHEWFYGHQESHKGSFLLYVKQKLARDSAQAHDVCLHWFKEWPPVVKVCMAFPNLAIGCLEFRMSKMTSESNKLACWPCTLKLGHQFDLHLVLSPFNMFFL